jgi:hypothetical protein
MEKTTREIVTTTIDTQHCDDLTPVSNKGCRLSPQLTTNNSLTFFYEQEQEKILKITHKKSHINIK